MGKAAAKAEALPGFVMVGKRGTKRAMEGAARAGKRRKPRPPLDADSLRELALAYVGRYSTTRAKLAAYLRRKLRERGWQEAAEPGVEALAERFAEQGYVDDSGYALAKSRSLSERGFGAMRVRRSLRAAGIGESDGAAARELAETQAVEAALRFARRRRLGPFAERKPDPKAREKAIAAMLRAGHRLGLAKAIVEMAPGTEPDLEELSASA